jgi:cytoskeletal protein CcmA (bactofilin family)
MADEVDDLDIPMRPGASKTATQTMPRVAAPKTSDQTLPPRQTDPRAQPQPNEVDTRTLLIGSGVSFSGDVRWCEHLVVEGTIEAKLPDCENLIVAEGGVFRGSGSTQNADVRGHVEGDFVVGKRLLIRTGGQVCGTITYNEIEIEPGGKISGTIHVAAKSKGLRAYAAPSQKRSG